MNSLLMKHKPKDMDKEVWRTLWRNSSPQLRPLLAVLSELRGGDSLTEADLMHPNLQQKVIWDASRRQTIDQITAIIQSSLDK